MDGSRKAGPGQLDGVGVAELDPQPGGQRLAETLVLIPEGPDLGAAVLEVGAQAGR